MVGGLFALGQHRDPDAGTEVDLLLIDADRLGERSLHGVSGLLGGPLRAEPRLTQSRGRAVA